MSSGDTSVNNTVSGYLVNEQVTLTTSPTGTNYQWTLSVPSNSNVVISALDSATAASPKFTPDVDGTTYTLMLTVLDASISNNVQIQRMQPIKDASVPTPSSSGARLVYNSLERGMVVTKDSAGKVRPDGYVGSVGTNLTDADQTLTVAGGQLYWLLDGTLTTTRTKTVGVSGASTRQAIIVVKLDDGQTVNFVNDGPGAGSWASAGKAALGFIVDGTDFSLEARIDLS